MINSNPLLLEIQLHPKEDKNITTLAQTQNTTDLGDLLN